MYNYWNYLFACSPKEKHKKGEARRGIYVFSLEKHVPNALLHIIPHRKVQMYANAGNNLGVGGASVEPGKLEKITLHFFSSSTWLC